MNVIAVTQKGINKTENEDRIIVGKSVVANGTLYAEFYDGVLAIADGVGGQNAGAMASHFVANSLCIIDELTVEKLTEINNELLNLSESNENLKGMATTLSGVCFRCEKTQLFSIGNTRVYTLQSRKYLKQVTTDDTTLNYLLAMGQLKPDEVDNFDRKNEITACFGGGCSDLFRVKVSDIERMTMPIMITSDGIHDYLSVDELEEFIELHGLTEMCCVEIIKAARSNGSVDDASIILGVV